jgi:hypothetical protein
MAESSLLPGIESGRQTERALLSLYPMFAI